MLSINHTRTLNEFGKRRAPSDDDDSADEVEAKIPKYCNWRLVMLEKESDVLIVTDDEIESSYSYQDKETDFARDTSDTCTHSEDSVGSSVWKIGELEVVSSDSDQDVGKDDGSSSSGSNDFIRKKDFITAIDLLLEDRGLLADSSGNSSSSSDNTLSDSEVPRADYWTCIKCNANTNPRFRYCEKCYRVRKSFFLPRPRGKKKNPRLDPKTSLKSTECRLKKATEASDGTISSDQVDTDQLQPVAGPSSAPDRLTTIPLPRSVPNQSSRSEDTPPTTSQSSQDIPPNCSQRTSSQDSELNASLSSWTGDTQPTSSKSSLSQDTPPNSSQRTSSQESVLSAGQGSSRDAHPNSSQENLCIMCLVRPKDGVYVHNGSGHQSSCYECARRVKRKSKRCPMCNRMIDQVIRIQGYSDFQ